MISKQNFVKKILTLEEKDPIRIAIYTPIYVKKQIPETYRKLLSENNDKIEGLKIGTDDYLSKPFEPRELLLRINIILRRAFVGNITEPIIEIQMGSCVYKMERGELWQDSKLVQLTIREAEFLKALALNACIPVSREALILDSKYGDNIRTVDVQVNRLRQKIETNPRQPRYLQTARGKGYVLRPD